jgi:hypothetical protein
MLQLCFPVSTGSLYNARFGAFVKHASRGTPDEDITNCSYLMAPTAFEITHSYSGRYVCLVTEEFQTTVTDRRTSHPLFCALTAFLKTWAQTNNDIPVRNNGIGSGWWQS